jgi:hypothetical protein
LWLTYATLAKRGSAKKIFGCEESTRMFAGFCVQRETIALKFIDAPCIRTRAQTMTGRSRYPVPSSSPRACRRVEGICRNVIVSGDTARSYNLPISLIKFAASQKDRTELCSHEWLERPVA